MLAVVWAGVGCAGPPVPSAIEAEPVCVDYEMGATRTKFQGSLKYPVRLTIRDGNTPITTKLILGLRAANDPPTRILLSDSNEEYTVEWAQCENERPTKPVTGGAHDTKEEAGRYECGTSSVYSTSKLATKKGDLTTHAVKFVAPPKPECWVSDAPSAVADADAGAPMDAGAGMDTDAGTGTDTDAGAVTDAGADTDAGTSAAAASASPSASAAASAAASATPSAHPSAAPSASPSAKPDAKKPTTK